MVRGRGLTRPDFSSRPRRQPAALGFLVLVIGVLAVVASAWSSWSAWRERRLAGLALSQLDSAARANPVLRDRDLAEAAAKLERATLRPPAGVMAALAGVLPADARYSSIVLSYDGAVRTELGVSAKSTTSYDALLQQLAGAAEIEQVLPGGESRSDEVDGRVRALFKVER